MKDTRLKGMEYRIHWSRKSIGQVVLLGLRNRSRHGQLDGAVDDL